jgi:hypothetical protein
MDKQKYNLSSIPTIKGLFKLFKKSNYNFERALLEFFDNSISAEANNIVITLAKAWNYNEIYQITISDDGNGFGNIRKNETETLKGIEAIQECFKFTTDRVRTNDDISENGIGFKSALVNLGTNLTCFTKNNDGECFKIIMNLNNMIEKNEQDILTGWCPTIIKISIDEYEKHHDFQNGSTFIITELNHEFIPTIEKSYELLKNIIISTYNYQLLDNNNLKFEINMENKSETINSETNNINNIFDDPDIPHIQKIEFPDETISINSYIINYIRVYKDRKRIFIIVEEDGELFTLSITKKYKNGNLRFEKKKFNICDIKDTDILLDRITFRSIFNLKEYSSGKIDLIRQYRLVGKNLDFKAERGDSWSSNIKHEIHYNNKKINTLLGTGFNKINDGNVQNEDLYSSLHYLQALHECKLKKIPKMKNKQKELKKKKVKKVEEIVEAEVVEEDIVTDKKVEEIMEAEVVEEDIVTDKKVEEIMEAEVVEEDIVTDKKVEEIVEAEVVEEDIVTDKKVEEIVEAEVVEVVEEDIVTDKKVEETVDAEVVEVVEEDIVTHKKVGETVDAEVVEVVEEDIVTHKKVGETVEAEKEETVVDNSFFVNDDDESIINNTVSNLDKLKTLLTNKLSNNEYVSRELINSINKKIKEWKLEIII